MTIPDHCDPFAGDDWWAYYGDFDFGDNNTLYLSTGKLSGFNNTLKVGVYTIDGASPDQVTGTVKRIYTGVGPIYGLCYQSPSTLYFLRYNGHCSIYKLDLSNNTEELQLTITEDDPNGSGQSSITGVSWFLSDITLTEDPSPAPWYWPIYSNLYLLLKWLTAFVKRFGIALRIGQWPAPPRMARHDVGAGAPRRVYRKQPARND